ncbi:MAG: hypothetical protein IJW00_03690 [Clostridia bacterium]|nr:hypothetical protein [Clostridia bacterium]
MSITRTTYKSRPALAVTTRAMTALFLPEDGGKLASIKTADGFEFLCQNPAPDYTPLTYDGSYVDSECASFDDMFPTVDPYTPTEGEYAGITYPDHGETCRLPYEVAINGGSVKLSASSRILPLTYEKVITPQPDGSLTVTYTIENSGNESLPFIWAAHCMLRGQDDLRIVTPYPADTPVTYMFGATAADSLPLDRLSGYVPGIGRAYKYYFDEPSDGGFVSAIYEESGHRFEMDFGTPFGSALPYLGVWINNGEFKDYYNIALECATAPYDAPDRAMRSGYCPEIPRRSRWEFTLRIRVEYPTNQSSTPS